MITVKESSSETSQTNKKPDKFSLQLSTKLFVVPSKGFLKIDVKNVAKKAQDVLITLESAIFTLRDYERETFPVQQSFMILKPSETKSFTIHVKDQFPETFNFDHILLASPEGQLTISHCDSKKKNGFLESKNGLMCLAHEKNEKLDWGSFTQKVMLDQETSLLRDQKKRYFEEREEFENKKAEETKQEKLSKESESENEKKGFECCCVIS